MNGKFCILISNNNFFTEARNKNSDISLIDMCNEFIKIYGQCIKYLNPDEIENENEEENENENEEENENENEIEKSNTSENEDNEKELDNQDLNIIKNNNQILKLKGSENNSSKTSFISLKMEIDTVLMFKLLIVLMIVAIVMIIVFLLRIEFKPLIHYRIPADYTHFTIQPPYNNVKKYSIYNRYNDSGLTTLFNLNKKDTSAPKLSKSQEIKQEIINEVKPVMDNSEETFVTSEKPKSEYFSSNYEFGI